MAKITEKQLISSLQQLKEIKPRKEWAVLLRSQILAEVQVETKVAEQPAKFAGFMNIFAERKMVYSFAVMLLLIFGAFGLVKLMPSEKLPNKSTASLTGQTGIKQNVVALNTRINDLVKVTKEGETDTIPSAKNDVKTTVSELAKSLKDNPVQDSDTIKDIASSLKTLADVPGTDLTATPDVQDLYQTVVHSQIADLQKTTLTDSQKKILTDAENLYGQGRYQEALEEIYNINQTISN